MNVPTESHAAQCARWPATGRHVLAHFNAETIVVYQAYAPLIGEYAVAHQKVGGPAFSFGRMSWVKPNFLWMMYRSGWGTKAGQEITLAVRIRRAGFDAMLAQAVHSSFVPEVYGSEDAWKRAVEASSVRLQWDPDHDPHGVPLERRAIQLGLRGEVLRRYATEWVVSIEDVSAFVREQRDRLKVGARILTPSEEVYPVEDPGVAAKLGIDPVA